MARMQPTLELAAHAFVTAVSGLIDVFGVAHVTAEQNIALHVALAATWQLVTIAVRNVDRRRV